MDESLSRATSAQFYSSYGGWDVMASMLEPLEFLRLQALNRRAYTVNVSRVQARWKIYRSLAVLSYFSP